MSRLSRFLVMPAGDRPAIGTPAAGGYIGAYVSYDGGATIYALIVAPVNSETSLPRYTFTDAGVSSATDGWANRLIGSTPGYALYYCRNYRGGSFNDWYWGAFHEMMAIFEGLNPVAQSYNFRTVSTIAIPTSAPNTPRTEAAIFQKGGQQAFGATTSVYGTSTGGEQFSSESRRYMGIYFVDAAHNGSQLITYNDGASRIRPIRKVLASTL